MAKRTARAATTELRHAAQLAKQSRPAFVRLIQAQAEKKSAAMLAFRENARIILASRCASIAAAIEQETSRAGVRSTKNFFELVGAERLAKANQLSRTVSTSLGKAWEDIACLSPQVVSPQRDLAIRLKGVDIVAVDKSALLHVQIKTQRNTLTGSQRTRSIRELGCYANPVFAAAFSVGPWTISPVPGLRIVAGDEFWSLIGLDYEAICAVAKIEILKLEKRLFGKTP
jgi:hypothetical protein